MLVGWWWISKRQRFFNTFEFYDCYGIDYNGRYLVAFTWHNNFNIDHRWSDGTSPVVKHMLNNQNGYAFKWTGVVGLGEIVTYSNIDTHAAVFNSHYTNVTYTNGILYGDINVPDPSLNTGFTSSPWAGYTAIDVSISVYLLKDILAMGIGKVYLHYTDSENQNMKQYITDVDNGTSAIRKLYA